MLWERVAVKRRYLGRAQDQRIGIVERASRVTTGRGSTTGVRERTGGTLTRRHVISRGDAVNQVSSTSIIVGAPNEYPASLPAYCYKTLNGGARDGVCMYVTSD